MYQSKLVACLKVNGKVLREFGETVYVPFGSEYSLTLKNLNSVKALAAITIDGEDVCPGGLVIEGNREINLERFVKDLNKGNRFKFIQRTAGIEKHRGIKVDDGLIRISFKYERKQPAFTNDWNQVKLGGSWGGGYNPDPNYYGTTNAIGKSAVLRSMTQDSFDAVGSVTCNAMYSANVASAEPQLMNIATTQSLAGITAPGSISDQKFHTASWFATEAEEHVMVMRLLGETETGVEIKQPVTVKTMPVCKMCGHKNKAKAKFCSECGCALEIV